MRRVILVGSSKSKHKQRMRRCVVRDRGFKGAKTYTLTFKSLHFYSIKTRLAVLNVKLIKFKLKNRQKNRSSCSLGADVKTFFSQSPTHPILFAFHSQFLLFRRRSKKVHLFSLFHSSLYIFFHFVYSRVGN